MKAIHCIKSIVAAVAVVVVGDSCTGMCTRLSSEAQNIKIRGTPNAVVLASAPEQIALTQGEIESMHATVDILSGIAEIVLDNSKSRHTYRNYKTKDTATDIARASISLMTKRGQELTIKCGRTTYILSQPVYCRFGEIKPGTRGRVQYFRALGRRIFIPL